MSSTLGLIRLCTSSVEVLTCWLEEIVLTNIPENRGSVMDNTAFHQGKASQQIFRRSSGFH
ncbi:hypothetical protein [Holospora curviuscula]|uniref:Uncharacterized protein n=1 Tax=Holospora curviuscula TaxID=1082868 RepID=A0A2S5RAI4_9PROT|nr:hypothetical protein [Holospora curviuscula]PPE04202.1 hypothetical protein HCUR_00393 [Holospora curviuscula]